MARSFNGSSSYIDLGSPSSLKLNTGFTLTAWINPSVNNAYQGIICYGNGGYYLRMNTSGKLDFLKSDVADILSGATTVTTGVWHHVAVTVDGSGNVVIYLGGASDATGTTAQTFGSPSQHFTIGAQPATGGGQNENWDGSIAEAAVYSTALTANEIAALASGRIPSTVRPQSLAAYWPLWGLLSPEPDLSGAGLQVLGSGAISLANHAPVTLFTRKRRIEIEPASGGLTYLSLAAQSAAWTNPTLTQLSALSLGQESAAWTDPAISLASLLSLAAESAAWTDPALTLSSSLALAAESASWTNPALAQALALALSQQSASWTNPALTIPGSSLALAAQSAAWTNPALSFASSLALAAESAGWTNPALNAAIVLALTGQSAAWSNPALTPSGSQGIVLQVPVQSAAWTVPPLGLFFCPTIVNPYFGLEWLVVVPGLPALAQESCVISNTEVVTLYRKRGDGSFDGGTLIGQALRLDAMKDGLVSSGAAKRKKELDWYMWASQTGAPEVKDGDYILDSAGNKWVIWNVDVQAWGNRYFVKTKLAQ